jgi:hypothetical protein
MPDYNPNVIANPQTAEYGKFTQLNGTRFPAVSVARIQYPDKSQAFPGNTNALPVTTIDVYPKFGVLSYIANTDDFAVSLSAGQINLDTSLIEFHISNIDAETTIMANALTATEWNTFDAASGINELNYNFVTAAAVLTANQFNTNTLLNSVTANQATAVNQTTTNTLLNSVTANQTTLVTLTRTLTANNATAVNQVVTNTLLNSVTANQATQITLEKTLSANSVFGTLSSQPLYVVNPDPVTTVTTITTPTQLDAFGRLRVSTPLTLFDSSHRYRDNNLWSTLTAVGGSYAFNQNQGLMDLTVSSASGSSVIRETTKVFSYQPGKSLLILNTFVFAPSTTNLRQRVGYYGVDNGIYVQLDGDVVSFVERSLVNGSPSTESIIPISAWNVDKLDGTGPSGFTLDITRAQISWMDVEWLGVGTVRCGFVIDGKFVHCHSFHHANRIASTYITTASLPLRYEITNKAATGVTRTMKQICSSVISEGGYELRGLQQAVGTAITAPKTLTTAGTYYPVVSLRLKASPNRLDAIVILTALSMMPVSTGNFSWRVIANGTTGGGGAWQDAGVDSAVEYKLDGTSITGGRILAEGYLTANATYGNSSIINILKEALFKFQLERNGLTNTPYEITLALTSSTGGETAHASVDWEEISR